ncbi:MAG TPA: BON domain-containing protein [Chloroflexota bacterium]|nr:BON domain-containing protein [Chloroflexota bacterium]
MKSFDFKFGAEVYGRDTSCGQLARLVVDPESWCVTHTIMESGLLFKQNKVVPISEVEEATAMDIRLTVGCQELAGYPSFSETVVERSAQGPGWVTPPQGGAVVGTTAATLLPTAAEMVTVQETVRQGVGDDKIVLGNNVAVYGLDGRVGHLSHLITLNDEPHCQIQYLVVTQGTLFPKLYIIPAHYVQTLSEQGIHILVTDAEIGEFPEFSTASAEITDSPGLWEDAWEDDEDTTPVKEGITPVGENDRVAMAVETALISDLRTETAVIDVINDRGIVTLTGTTPDWTAREVAETIASHQPGVIKVINDLTVETS